MHEEIVTVAILVAAEGRADELLDILRQCAGHTRAEPGCLQYDFFRERSEPERIVAFERWSSAADLELHRESAHVRAMSAGLRTPGLLEGRPTLIYTEPVDVGG